MNILNQFTLWPPQTQITCPCGSDVVGVHQQFADIILIMECDPSEVSEVREFIVVEEHGTVPEGELQLIGTVPLDGNSRFCVVYEKLD